MSSHYEKFLATGEVKCIDEEIPFEIPEGWEWCRFSNVYKSLTDGTHSTPHYKENGIPFLSVKDMSNGCLNFSNTKYISESEHAELSKRCHPQKGDLLLSKVGTTGIPLIIETEREFSIFVSLALIKFTSVPINKKFLLLLFKTPFVQEQVNENTRGVGNKNWVLAAIANTMILLPPLNEQNRIVSKLEELTPALNRYTESQFTLEELNTQLTSSLKKSILQEVIQGKLVPQRESEGTARELLEQIRKEKQKLVKEGKLKKSALSDSVIYKGDDNKYYEQVGKQCKDITEEIRFDLPEQWQWCRIGTLFMHNNGKQLNKGNTKGKLMDYITTSNLYWDGFVLENLKKMPFEDSEIERCMAIKGDLLVCEGGDIGRSCIWCYDFPIMLQNHIHKLRPYVKVCIEYFYYIFYFYNMVGLIGGKGIGIQGFSSKALHNTIVPLPPIAEQQRIVAQIERLFEQLK